MISTYMYTNEAYETHATITLQNLLGASNDEIMNGIEQAVIDTRKRGILLENVKLLAEPDAYNWLIVYYPIMYFRTVHTLTEKTAWCKLLNLVGIRCEDYAVKGTATMYIHPSYVDKVRGDMLQGKICVAGYDISFGICSVKH